MKIWIAASAALLLGFGVYLGYATKSAPAPAAVVAAPAVAARVAPQRAPTLVRVVPGLDRDLRDPDPRVRRAAIREVVAGSKDPVTLLAASRDADVGVAVVATTGLGELYRDGQITAKDLTDRITDHQLAEKVRVTAMNGLGVVASPEGAATMSDLIAHGDATDRRSAAILLQHQDAAAAVPSLIAALGDGDDIVRDNAVASLRSFARGRDFGQDAAAWQRWWQSRSL